MISVESRDGRKSLGLGFGSSGREMEETELEEGEAYDYHDYDEANIDPDVDLSYLDEKVQVVLGHFQKDFEGGVSAENLGAKFGGYGSFLPSYQRSPSIWSQPRTPQTVQNYGTPRSPNVPVEGDSQYSALPSGATSAVKQAASRTDAPPPISRAPFAESSSVKESNLLSVQSMSEYNSRSESLSKVNNATDQKTLKVRLKVGSDNMAQKAAAIFNDLGFPPSSPEDSPVESGGFSPEYRESPDESPTSILQIMTSSPVPDGLLSPLADSLLHLTKKEKLSRDNRLGLVSRDSQGNSSILVDESSTKTEEGKGFGGKKMKPVENNSWSIGIKHGMVKDVWGEYNALPNKETHVETPEAREVIADFTKLPVPSNSKLMVAETAKGTSRASEVSSETKKFKVKDRYISSDFVKDDSESITSLDVKKAEKLKLRTTSGDKVSEERKEGRETAKGTSRASEVSSETKKFKVKDRYISSDFVKDDSESITSLDVKKAEKLKLRTSSGDKVSEERKENPQKDVQPVPRKDGKNKGNKGYDSCKADFDGSKGRKELNVGTIDPPENKVILKMSSFDRDAGKLPYITEQTSSGGKKKSRGSKNNGNPVELSQESLRVVSTAASKEKRKSSGDSSSRIKVDDSKSRMDCGKKRETYRDIFGDEEMEPAENSANSLEKPFRDRRKDYKLEFSEKETRQIADKPKERLSDKEIHQFADKSRERQHSKMIENPLTFGAYQKAVGVIPPTGNGVASEAVSASVAPMAPLELINEDWVACDKCQQWRLLPFGVNPDNLPKKWVCSMSYWLPGMNHCNISEDDTTKAMRSLMYQVPAPESNLHSQPNGAASGVTLSQVQHLDSKHQEHSLLGVPSGGRKKLGMKETTDSDNLMGPMHSSNPPSKSQQVSLKSRSLTDVNQSPLDHNVANKAVVPHLSKSSDSAARKHRHKQKDKHKLAPDGGETNHSKTKSKREDDLDGSRSSKKIKTEGLFSAKEEWNSDHGAITGETNHSKIKSKKESDQDGSRSSKKIKSEGLFSAKEEWNSDHGGIMGNSGPISINCSFAKEAPRSTKKHGEYSSSKESRFDIKDNITSVKKPKELVQVSLDAGKFDSRDIAAKKRKVKEWQESQAYPLEPVTDSGHHTETNKVSLEGTSESELKRGKKAKTSRSEGKESRISTADVRTDKRDRTSLIFSSSSRNIVAPEIEDGKGYVGRDKLQAEYRGGNMASQPTLDTVDPLRRDLGYGLPSLAATSSSSKVSGSRKSKGNFQEAKGSPVESVSSSPLRIPDKGTSARRISVGKEDATNVGSSIIGLRRCSDGEGDGRDVRSGSEKRETDHSVFHRGSLESSVLDYQDREVTRTAGSKSKAPTQSFSLEKENAHLVNGGANTVDQSIQHVTLLGKEHGYDDDHVNKHHGSNGSLSRKSGKSSSLRSKDKQKGSKSDGNKGKLKVSDSSNNQEGVYPTKHSRNKAETESQDLLYHDEESRGGKYRSQEKHDIKGGKDEKSYPAKKEYLGKWSNEDRRDNHSKYGGNVGIDVKSSATCSKDGKFNLHQNSMQDGVGERSSHKSHADRPDHEQLEKTLRGKSQSFPHTGDKQETQTRCPRPVSGNHKGSGTDSLRVDASSGFGDDLKAAKQPRKLDNQAGPVHNSLRHSTPGRIAAGDVDGPSPVRKDSSSQAANSALKEARDLKHSADRLKNSGSGLESTGLYFEAVLKFLHGASLLEPGNAESSRHGESQSVHVYSTTASLCEFVAQEYERCKEMAFAALAYKCLEVACMRVVYFKHWSINKDRHELQSALHVGPPGESPSSSASDVDNLNNQGTVDKLALAKCVGSPHVAGNHVIAARSRPNFVRVLNFTQDVNSAMEASRKSQNAFAAASASLEESQYEGICSVKRALDFNFHDVQGLLRLVRLAMEAISR